MHSHWRFTALALGSLCWAVTSQSVDFIGSEVYYELFRPGDAKTDQSAGAPGSHSNLVGHKGEVSDVQFAENVAMPALAAHASLYFVLNQCFSGGFINELANLGGTQSIFTAARHSETARYGLPAPGGVDLDSTDTFNIALADGRVPAATVAAESVALNPFGPNPNAKRINELLGSEHAQYFATGGGDQLKPADYADSGIAVLWAGAPAERDGIQMNHMIERLVAMGFSPEKIWLLYGGGIIERSHPIARAHFEGRSHPIHLQAATQKNLFAVFENNFSRKNPSPPNFVFFYVGDHGGLNSLAVAKVGFTPDPLVAPNFQIKPEMKIYGDGE